MKKKVIATVLTGLLVMGLSACGSTVNETTADTNSQTTKSGTPESANGVNGTTATATGDRKTLVVYYSATGTTENVANIIAENMNAQLYELEPVQPYTNDDLDWTNANSRVSVEHDNPNNREVELTSAVVDNWDTYDTVYIGYPIWWGIAAWPVDGFVKANNFEGKTVIPFCTAVSSGIGESGKLLQEMAGTGNWLEGECFRSSASTEDIQKWVESLKL